jgi:hypothetical protein
VLVARLYYAKKPLPSPWPVATDGTGNALGLRYNHTMATFPAAYDFPDVPPGELKPSISAPGCTDLYKKVFE